MDKVNTSDLCNRVLESHSRLLEIWASFNYTDYEIDRRENRFAKHILEMCSDMIRTEAEELDKVRKSIELKRYEIEELIVELDSPEPNHFSPERISNLSLVDQLKKLEMKSMDLKEQIKNLCVKCKVVQDELGSICEEMHEDASEFIPSAGSTIQKRIDGMKERIQVLRKEKKSRIEKIEHLSNNILQNLKCLSKDTHENQVRFVNPKYSPSSEHISNLKILDKKFAKEVEMERHQISVVYKEIEPLWKRLETEEKRISEVTAIYRNKTTPLVTILLRLQAELKQCLKEKDEKIQLVLARAGKQLESLWELCFWDRSKRKEFLVGLEGLSGDEKIAAHDREILFLEKLSESNSDTFNSVRKYINAWEEWKALQSSDQSNPSRLANRGGRLLMEEKKRNSILKKLREVEITISSMVEPQSMHGDATIRIYGKSVKLWLIDYKESQTKRELARSASVAVKRSHNFETSNTSSNGSTTIGLQRSASCKSFAKSVAEVNNNTAFLKRFPSVNGFGAGRPILRGKPVLARKLTRRKSGRHSISTPERIRNEQSASTLMGAPTSFTVKSFDLDSTDFDFTKTSGNEDGKGLFLFGLPRHTSTPLVVPDPNSANKVPTN